MIDFPLSASDSEAACDIDQGRDDIVPGKAQVGFRPEKLQEPASSALTSSHLLHIAWATSKLGLPKKKTIPSVIKAGKYNSASSSRVLLKLFEGFDRISE